MHWDEILWFICLYLYMFYVDQTTWFIYQLERNFKTIKNILIINHVTLTYNGKNRVFYVFYRFLCDNKIIWYMDSIFLITRKFCTFWDIYYIIIDYFEFYLYMLYIGNNTYLIIDILSFSKNCITKYFQDFITIIWQVRVIL